MVVTVYSPLFAVMCMSFLVAFVSLPLFKAADVRPGRRAGRRVATLDGLRGLLALSVFLHHAIVNYQYQRTGVWTVPPSTFYAMLGQGGVALFFMITGYLFWTKLLLEKGRPRWTQLFIGRAFRIGPLYLLFVALMVTTVFAQSHWRFRGDALRFRQVARLVGAVRRAGARARPQSSDEQLGQHRRRDVEPAIRMGFLRLPRAPGLVRAKQGRVHRRLRRRHHRLARHRGAVRAAEPRGAAAGLRGDLPGRHDHRRRAERRRSPRRAAKMDVRPRARPDLRRAVLLPVGPRRRPPSPSWP